MQQLDGGVADALGAAVRRRARQHLARVAVHCATYNTLLSVPLAPARLPNQRIPAWSKHLTGAKTSGAVSHRTASLQSCGQRPPSK